MSNFNFITVNIEKLRRTITHTKFQGEFSKVKS